MTTTEVANKLVELCRQGKIDEVQETLFADNAQSIEANEMMGPKFVTGLDLSLIHISEPTRPY